MMDAAYELAGQMIGLAQRLHSGVAFAEHSSNILRRLQALGKLAVGRRLVALPRLAKPPLAKLGLGDRVTGTLIEANSRPVVAPTIGRGVDGSLAKSMPRQSLIGGRQVALPQLSRAVRGAVSLQTAGTRPVLPLALKITAGPTAALGEPAMSPAAKRTSGLVRGSHGLAGTGARTALLMLRTPRGGIAPVQLARGNPLMAARHRDQERFAGLQHDAAPGFARTVHQAPRQAAPGNVYLDKTLVGYHLAAAVTAEQTRAAARPNGWGASFNGSMAALRPAGAGL